MRPSSVGLRGQALNRPELRWLKTVVVSVREKACLTRQVGTRKTCQRVGRDAAAPTDDTADASLSVGGIETEGQTESLGTSLAGARVLARWCPACRWREPGLPLLLGT